MTEANHPEMSQNHSVIIIGKGISGLVLSILLKRQGIGHLLLARHEKIPALALGETLPPSTLALLEKLQLRALFETCGQRTSGYYSLWGSDRLQHISFTEQKPFNYGLKLSKQALLDTLEAEVSEHMLYVDRLKHCRIAADKVEIEALANKQSIQLTTPLVIDGAKARITPGDKTPQRREGTDVVEDGA